jgi:hypothetical protein
MLFAVIFAAAAAPAVPAAPKPPAPAKPAAQTVDLGAFTEFPCFENRTKYVIGGYVRTGAGKVEIVPVAPNSGGCLAKLRPDPANPGMSVGTAFLDKTATTETDLLGREVNCVMSPKAMKDVGFRVVVMEEDAGLFCQSVVLDKVKAK